MPVKVLVVLPVLPWPPRRDGMSVRFLPILKYLGSKYFVDLVVIDDLARRDASERIPEVRSIAFLRSRDRRLPMALQKVLTALRGIAPLGAPLGQIDYKDRRQLKNELRKRISSGGYSAVLVSGAPWMMTRALGYPASCRVIYDFVDSPTLHMRRGGWLGGMQRYLQSHTERKCARLERGIRRFAAACVYVSRPDAEAIGRVEGAPEPTVIPNGVTVDIESEPAMMPRQPVVGFLGNMGYWPNVTAARRLVLDVMPHIRAAVPEARLVLIGRDPTPEILELQSDFVTVTGTVEDIWPHVRQVRVFVFPMFSGAGLQNKILEAMHGGVPVVTTPLSARSLGAAAGSDLLVADTDGELAHCAIKVLRDESLWADISGAGRRFVDERHSWSTLGRQYADVLLADHDVKPGSMSTVR
jgi:glycosyltransferase involved in cell wall biosynthesis